MSSKVERGAWILMLLPLAALALWLALRRPGERPTATDGSASIGRRDDPGRRSEPSPAPPRETSGQRVALEPAKPPAPASAQPESSERATIRARFVDQRGAPIAGVTLRVAGVEGDRDPSAISGSGGSIALELDPEVAGLSATAELALEAACPGYALERRSARVAPGGETALGDWVLADAGSVAGRVIGEDGRGLEGASVACLAESVHWTDWEARRLEALDRFARPGARAASATDGSFLLHDAPAGRNRLVAALEGHAAGASEPCDIPQGGLVEAIEIRMGPALATRIAGTVVGPDGAPVPFARTRLSSARVTHESRAGADGRFAFRGLAPGTYALLAFDPEQLLGEAHAEDVRPGTQDLVLRLAEAPALELLVLAVDGAPVERFAASVRAAEDETLLAAFSEDERPGGLCAFARPATSFVVDVVAPGWMPARLGPLAPEGAPERLECRLEPARGLAGQVVALGQPLPGARLALHRALVRWCEHNGCPVRFEPAAHARATSDARGEFVLSVSEPGSYTLIAEAPGFALAEIGPLALDPRSTQRVRVELGKGGSLLVRVRSDRGADAGSAIVLLSRGDARARTQRAGPDGTLFLEQLTPGPWQVALAKEELVPGMELVRESDEEPAEISWNCAIVAGETTELELLLEGTAGGACRLRGTLVLDGEPAQGWLAMFQDAALASAPQPFQAPGTFELASPRSGEQVLFLTTDAVDPAGMLVILDRVTLAEGPNEWSLELETGALAGTLAPAPGAQERLLFHQWERDELRCLALLQPDATGRFQKPRVPAGKGRIVRYDPNTPLERQPPEVLLELEVEPGRTTEIELPERKSQK